MVFSSITTWPVGVGSEDVWFMKIASYPATPVPEDSNVLPWMFNPSTLPPVGFAASRYVCSACEISSKLAALAVRNVLAWISTLSPPMTNPLE